MKNVCSFKGNAERGEFFAKVTAEDQRFVYSWYIIDDENAS